MEKSLKKILSGIVDYAGLFPPANLPFEAAMAEYKKYRHSDYDWMLSRFIISFEQFGELKMLSGSENLLPDPLRLSITAAPTDSAEEYYSLVKDIVTNTLQLHEETPELLQTQILELKLPKQVLKRSNDEEILNLIEKTVQAVCKNPLLPYHIFFEVPGFEFDIHLAEKVIKAISTHNKSIEENELEHYKFSGFKIRCGGVKAYQFPPSGYLSAAIICARDAGVPLKFTAGLHHPVRLFHSSVQTKMYGFFNVFGAGILAHTQNLSIEKTAEILEDEDSGSFTFTSQYFEWKGLKASLAEIQKLRKKLLISFGSCSMAEPVEDLQELGLIE
ncbi:MAG: hypothetical protein WD059_03955 [Balneolaceae bacterium]